MLEDGTTQRGKTAHRSAVRLAAIAAAICAAIAAAMLLRPATADAVPREFFGVSAITPTETDFDLMRQSRVGTYRIMLSWPSVQQSANGPYDWSLPDQEIESAARSGMRPFPFVYGAPAFAAGERTTPPLGSELARAGWQSFVRAAVERYGPEGTFWALNPSVPYMPVQAWQIWNEQNARHYTTPKPKPKKYAKLLKLSQKAIERADERAQIVLGGMYGYPNEAKSIYMAPFLKKLYRVRGIRKRFDAVSVHPYGGTIELMTEQIKTARRIMKRNRDRKASVWITEIGWATDGPKGWPIVVGKQGQAQRLRDAFDLLRERRRRYRIKRVIWFAWRDFEQDICAWCGGAGLLDRDGNPKPAWREFRQFTGAAP